MYVGSTSYFEQTLVVNESYLFFVFFIKKSLLANFRIFLNKFKWETFVFFTILINFARRKKTNYGKARLRVLILIFIKIDYQKYLLQYDASDIKNLSCFTYVFVSKNNCCSFHIHLLFQLLVSQIIFITFF